MLTLILRSIMSLVPFIREVVDNLQKGPRDRRARNPLTTWLVFSIVFIIAGLATTVVKGMNYFDQHQATSLENVELKHKIELMADVSNENLQLKQRYRELQETVESDRETNRDLRSQLRDLQTTLTGVQQDLDDYRKQITELRDLVSSLQRDKTELANQLANVTASEALERPVPVVQHQPKRLSARTKALIAELQTN